MESLELAAAAAAAAAVAKDGGVDLEKEFSSKGKKGKRKKEQELNLKPIDPAVLNEWKTAGEENIKQLKKLRELTSLLQENNCVCFDVLYEVKLPSGGRKQVVLHHGIVGQRDE